MMKRLIGSRQRSALLGAGAEDLEQNAAGNLGWAYFQLGDDERALQQFLKAEKSAAALATSAGNLTG